MPHPSDPELLVLHGLRLKSFASAEVLAAATGLALDVVTGSLEQFRDKEWVRHRDGAITGWMLLAAGRAEGERRVHDELDQIGARAEIDADYRQFLTLNQPLLQVCTDWQLRRTPASRSGATTPARPGQNVIGALRSSISRSAIVASSPRCSTASPDTAPGCTTQTAADGDHDWFPSHHRLVPHGVVRAARNLLATLGIEARPRGVRDGARPHFADVRSKRKDDPFGLPLPW
jgi:hypothetical protein